MLYHGESPVDIDDEGLEPEGGLLWSTATIGIAALILLVTNAVSLDDWVQDMPPSSMQEQAAQAAADWHDATSQLGVAAPRAWLHGLWKRAEASRFDSGASPAAASSDAGGAKDQR